MLRFAPLLGVLAHLGSCAHFPGAGHLGGGGAHAAFRPASAAPALHAAVAATRTVAAIARPVAAAALDTVAAAAVAPADGALVLRPGNLALPDVWPCEGPVDCAPAGVCDLVTRSELSDQAGFIVGACRPVCRTDGDCAPSDRCADGLDPGTPEAGGCVPR